jgi:hypothetical protein
VKVLGKAVGPYTLISPLAGVDCYYYRAVAWNGRDAQKEEELKGRATETLSTPFFIEDETGRLMIDPRGAQLELSAEYNEPISGISMSEGARRFLRRHGLSTAADTTVSEYAIKPGEPLLVLGTIAQNPGLGSMADVAPEIKNTYLSREAANLQRHEQLEAMGISSAELSEDNAEAVVALGRDDFDLHPRVVLGTGNGGPPFVISRTTPQTMIGDLARSSVLDIWGGPILALFSLGLLMRWLGQR